MDRSEVAVSQLLAHLEFSDVVYEPDGNIPPDFLINGKIAVEVRRLNQNYDDGTGTRGLEETSTPLWQKMTRLVESIAATEGNSWFVGFNFSRPLPPWGSLEPELRKALTRFKALPQKSAQTIYACKNFEVDVAEASQPLQTFFRMGGMSDRQAGGWVVAELISNIQHCASEKLVKIAPYRGKYKTWWLALTNYTGFSLDHHDRLQLKEHLPQFDAWDRILLVNPKDPSDWIEL